MNEQASLAGITFTENGYVDVVQLNALYRLIGWDSHHRRTAAETTAMLRVSHYYIAAHTAAGTLVGFARVCGDPYIAQVLDVITHPAYRRRGIATQCMRGVLAHLQRSRYVSVTLTDGSGIAGCYQRSGFRVCKEEESHGGPTSDDAHWPGDHAPCSRRRSVQEEPARPTYRS